MFSNYLSANGFTFGLSHLRPRATWWTRLGRKYELMRDLLRIVRVLLFVLLGFVAGSIGGFFLILLLSSNQHDKSLEAAMTAIFVCGPIGAALSGAMAFLRRS